ncbi:glycosyltransferase [Eubacterium sp. am_0171]|uniref:glycosyltransferase family 2 protein n=1 Tax=unclassified Eubacterium (in: firmicutes) TaxID=2624479 RepID=UPI00102099D4|nr:MULTISPECIES: glycosyltransferase family 2 protein [unclassified Eubacterium (in: firmicutes)]MSC84097.1 glycosyltransferase [Eubacterium sp. BIOML-A1]MSD06524.1 glycosyltransferase [Eubacterium sp. BIOML-A2]RYT19607.1 glycosyltransferase [Eubacterium sp. am_0171]
MPKEKISLIVPCYNEEEVLPYFFEEFKKTAGQLAEYELELLFVDDGSKDSTLDLAKDMAKSDSRVKYLSFSRNFGKEAAIYAGLQKTDGDYAVLMDADLQDPPSLLPEMLKAVKEEGYDSAATRRVTRKGEPPIRSFFARRFYHLMNKISSAEIMDGARDYRLMNRKFKNAILEMSEYNRFSKGIFGWVGFRTKWIEFENVERIAGETKWSFFKLFRYSLEGIIGFSTALLAMASILGMTVCAAAFIFLIIILVKTLCFGDPVAGWPSMTCIILMLGGIQLLCMGILGMYLSKTYLETKKRPIYICDESNLEEEGEEKKK